MFRRIIDLRSDTVSKMSSSMFRALENAQVGDDVYGDDPTVNKLQDHFAKLFGKEKGLLTISGTMSNLISVLSHCQRGESAILTAHNHLNFYEQGNISSIAGVFPMVIPENPDGTVNFSDVQRFILPENQHFTRTTLLCLENTHNLLCGKALPLSFNAELKNFKAKSPIKTHLDGSRLLNAYYFHKETHKNLKVSDITEGFDSVAMCLSKALRCPIGSVLVGSEEFISKAHRWRKALGGAFRQMGYVAAAALQSLEEADEVVNKDHLHARMLAKEFEAKGVKVEKSDTNFVVFWPHLEGGVAEYVKRLENVGIKASSKPDGSIRLVFHENVKEEDISEVTSRIFNKSF